jgi:SIR2-like domain
MTVAGTRTTSRSFGRWNAGDEPLLPPQHSRAFHTSPLQIIKIPSNMAPLYSPDETETHATMTIEQDAASAIELVATAVREQRCVLFLGAGVHASPPDKSAFDYPAEHRPPRGSALSRALAAGCDLSTRYPDEDPCNLQRVALFHEITHSRRHLVEAITKAVHTDKRPSPLLAALARLDFPVIISTNYDHLFERALRAAGKDPRISVYTPEREKTIDFRDPTADSPILFKIHGDVARPETLVVTDEDYIQFVLRMSDRERYDPVRFTVKYHLTGWTTLFVGYSLLDYNLRLLFKTLRWDVDSANIPDTYSVDHEPDPLIFDVWDNQRRYVKFIAQDAWAFVPRLYESVLGRRLSP